MQKISWAERGGVEKCASSPVVDSRLGGAHPHGGQRGESELQCWEQSSKATIFTPLWYWSHSLCTTMLAKQDIKKSWEAKKSGPSGGGPSGTPCLPLPTSEFLSPTQQFNNLPNHPMPISCPSPPLSTWTGNYLLFFFSSSPSEIQTTAKTNLLLIVISRPPFLQNCRIIAQVNCKLAFSLGMGPSTTPPSCRIPCISSIKHRLKSWKTKEETRPSLYVVAAHTGLP